MQRLKTVLAMLLVIAISMCMPVAVFAEDKPKTSIMYIKTHELGAGSVEEYRMDILSVTNVVKEWSEETGLYGSFKHQLHMEVLGSTVLTSLMDDVTFTVLKVNRKGDQIYVLEKYYQDDEHYAVEDYDYEYYKEGSYIKIDQPGEYIVDAMVYRQDFGWIGTIKVLPDDTQKFMVNPTTSTVLVDGKAIEFEAYNINGNNYFKLRDIAKAVSGSKKQFDITWDSNYLAITLYPGKAYTEVGGELKPGDGKAKQAVVSTARVFRDGEKTALSVQAYNINGNNYFKLRDIAKALDIGVTWDSSTKTIKINTMESYVEE